MRVDILMFLTLLLGSCLDLGQALFLKAFKGLKGGGSYGGYNAGYGAGYSSGYGGGYASNYDYNPGYASSYGYNGGYGAGQASSYGYNPGYALNYGYNGGYGDNSGHGGYGNYGGYSGYSQQPYRRRYSQPRRTGRTYSDIAKVGRADRYLGLGAVRYIPNAPYSQLWG